MTPKRLAEAMGMSAAAVTTIIDRLEDAAYVERKRGDGDRRSVHVHAMEGSGKKVERLYRSLRDLAEPSLVSYSEKDLKVIHTFFSTATVMLRKATVELQQ
jgi:DNA-binding MarR family transcriptional regulator